MIEDLAAYAYGLTVIAVYLLIVNLFVGLPFLPGVAVLLAAVAGGIWIVIGALIMLEERNRE